MGIKVTRGAGRRLIVAATIVTVGIALDVAAAKPTKPNVQTTARTSRGWVCNAYGRTGTWVTHTGSHKATRTAAEQDALVYCREDAFACRLTGCRLE
ncbi:hypothetical protein NP284_08560 [Rhodopseudomonas pseudopalustris]|uniref:hypothetical protein n=1 Tax=Rhodopseudomonas pseudopalustris TaxID=1513892 RepID=UPI003F95071E